MKIRGLLLITIFNLSLACIANASSTKDENNWVNPLVSGKSNRQLSHHKKSFHHFLVELKPAYFIPQSDAFRDMYSGGFIPIAEVGYYFNKSLCLSLEGGYFHKHGTIHDFGMSTTITQVPVSLLIKYIYNFKNKFRVYGKVGPNYLYTHEKINYFDAPSHTSNTIGVTLGLGLLYQFNNRWLMDVFTNYRYDQNDSNILGGFDLGLGVGYRF